MSATQTAGSTARSRKPLAPATGGVRWLDGSADAREALDGGRVALLRLTVATKAGPVSEFYAVGSTSEGWLLTHDGAKGAAPVHYHVSRDCRTCDRIRPEEDRRCERGECKHCRGLAAALRQIGLIL